MPIVDKFKSLHKDPHFDSSMSVCLKYFSVNQFNKIFYYSSEFIYDYVLRIVRQGDYITIRIDPSDYDLIEINSNNYGDNRFMHKVV